MNLSRIRFSYLKDGLQQGRRNLIAAALLAALLWLVAGIVTAQSGAVPGERPDAAAGLPVHSERCANCHGVIGQGDGELAANLPNPPAAHGSTEYLRTAVPSEMFDVVTNGRVPMGMPPFGPDSSNPLSESERWNLIVALYSFGTPIESVEQGQVIYEENCLACHGEDGQGDGPEAAALSTDPGDLRDLNYWFTTSNQAVFDTLAEGSAIEAHDFDLSDEELWSVVDYMRGFSYVYTDALAQFRPLETAAVSGQVMNGTTGDAVTENASALLRAFTQDLEITLTMTDTLDAEGRFQFDLTDVPQDWFFRVALNYDDVEFGSDFGQVSFSQPELDLPITVFDKTSDPSAINIQQMHAVLVFNENQVVVSELYIVSNDSATVFVGESGNPEQGTFELAIPEAAEQVTIQRGFGSIDSFIPANEVIQTESGWADTLPLRPGPGSLMLLVQYALPYEDQLSIAHPLNYPTAGVNLVLPEMGVILDEADGWVNRGTQEMEGGIVTAYGLTDLAAGSEIKLSLEGQPRLETSSASRVVSDNATELVIGVVAALVVIGVAAVVIRRWRLDTEEEMWDRDELMQAIADLDDAYEAGEIEEDDYHHQREELKAELMAIWEEEENASSA